MKTRIALALLISLSLATPAMAGSTFEGTAALKTKAAKRSINHKKPQIGGKPYPYVKTRSSKNPY
jgi:hypothetical protein